MEFEWTKADIKTMVDFYLALKGQSANRPMPAEASRALRKGMTRALIAGFQDYLKTLEGESKGT